MTMGEVKGRMSLCFPFSMLEPVVPNLSLRRWIAETSGEEDQAGSVEISRAIPDVGLEVRALFGSIPVSIHELSHLKPGDILRLDLGPKSLGLVEVEGVPKFMAKVGTVNRKRAVQIVAAISEGASSHVARSRS
jgi:flagellar motor switch protein FliM